MSQEHHEEVVRHVIVGCHSLLFFSEVMRERCFKVVRSRSKNYLVTVNGLTLNHKCDVTELRLVEYGEKVTLVLVSHSCLAIGQAGEGAAQRDCIRCIRLVLIRLVPS